MNPTAYILVSTRNERALAEHLSNFETAKEIHGLFGQWDLIVKAETEKMSDLQDFINNVIRANEHVQGTETLIVGESMQN